jgi:hypothetical protein
MHVIMQLVTASTSRFYRYVNFFSAIRELLAKDWTVIICEGNQWVDILTKLDASGDESNGDEPLSLFMNPSLAFSPHICGCFRSILFLM